VTRPEIGFAFQSDKRFGDYGRLAVLAEAAGADVFALYGDLLYQPPLPGLLEAARATSRVRIGPTCLNPYTMHPYEIAGQVATLDLASRGRAYLGLSRGSWLDAIGIEPAKPIVHLAEAAAIVNRLLARNREGFEGEVYHLDPDVSLRYEPRRPEVPLLIGSWGRRTLGLAGRIADEAKVGGSANPEMASVARRWVDAGAVAAGRSPGDVALVVGAVTVVDEDRTVARALAREEVATYLDVVAELDVTYEVPADVLAAVRARLADDDTASAGAAIPNEVLERFAFCGTPEDVAAQAAALVAVGVDRVEFGTPLGLAPEIGIELMGKHVIPALRR
jgi:5,10-methylenetetrahydromethanopterin reductase